MDGNGRWAKKRFLPRTAGHKKGVDAVQRAIEAAVSANVSYLTLFGFSSENWKRPVDEVNDLMGLLHSYLKSHTKRLHEEGIKLRFIGDRLRLSPEIQSLLQQSEALTQDNTKLTLVIALSYGARAELTAAAQQIAYDVAEGRLSAGDVTEDLFQSKLFTHDIPDPDILIRTSGEQRVSNFLLWQLAYTEFVFQDVLWPDFNADDFNAALEAYQTRDRRYGAVKA